MVVSVCQLPSPIVNVFFCVNELKLYLWVIYSIHQTMKEKNYIIGG